MSVIIYIVSMLRFIRLPSSVTLFTLALFVGPVSLADECSRVFATAEAPLPELKVTTNARLDDSDFNENSFPTLSVHNGERGATYKRTNNGIRLHDAGYFPKEVLAIENLRGLKVLDVGTGGGQFVFDLRKEDIEAYGVDLLLAPRQKNSGFFYEASAHKLPIESETFDVGLSINSLFESSYMSQHSDQFMIACLKEVARVTKKGGRFYIAWPDHPRMERLLKSVPEMAGVFPKFKLRDYPGYVGRVSEYLMLTKQ